MSGQQSEAAIEVAAPPEAIFEWLVDPAKVGEWMQTSANWYPAEREELAVGYTGTESMDLPAMDGTIVPTTTTIEVTAYDPPREFATVTTNPSVEVAAGYVLTPAGAGTRVESSMRTTYLGETAAVMEMPAAAEQAKALQDQGLIQSLERLRSLVEGEG